MKVVMKLLVTSFITLISSVVFAGNSGGGGNAVVCTTVPGAGVIDSAEVLDVFEAKNLLGLTVPESNAPYKKQVEDALNKIAVSTADPAGSPNPPGESYDVHEIRWRAEWLEDHIRIMNPGIEVTPIADSFPPISKKGCSIKQLAAYLNDNVVVVDGDYWAKLSETNRAALILHEAVYRFYRGLGDTDSRRARNLVGHLLSTFEFSKIYEVLMWKRYFCTTDNVNGRFQPPYVFVLGQDPSDSETTIAQFMQFNGAPVFTRTKGSIGNPINWKTGVVGGIWAGGNIDSTLDEASQQMLIKVKGADGIFPTRIVGSISSEPEIPNQETSKIQSYDFYCDLIE